jgi:hypothetical protein
VGSAQLSTLPAVRGVHLRRGPVRPGRRLMARVRGPWLDRELATGVPPWQSAVHAARAVQLTSRHRRRGLARTLERLLRDAEHPPALALGAAVRPCRSQVMPAAPALRAIVTRLRSGAPLEARGIAALLAVLSDGSGPCYSRADPGALTARLETVSRWLDVED